MTAPVQRLAVQALAHVPGIQSNLSIIVAISSRYSLLFRHKLFETFTFSPAGAAVYQLGPYGTAAKKLKEWDLKR